ncbi:MAG: hypothetical protein D6715_05765 [Calditrichaeota bacterium]|nr:MAG: hypothetical protein D6715_05765 [Calditrichota bacterium]
MKRQMGILLVIAAVLLAMMGLTGCEKNPEGAVSEDVELQSFAQDENVDLLFDEGIDDPDIEGTTAPGTPFAFKNGLGELLSPLNNVVRYGRRIRERFPRTLAIRRIAPDTFKVFLERVLAGNFVVVEKLNSEADTFVVHRKPLRHIVRRTAIFVRKATDRVSDNPSDLERDRRPRRGRWMLNAISLLQGNSPNSTIRIHEVTVTSSGGQSFSFSDPLHTLLEIPGDIPVFAPGEEVVVQVSVENNTPNPLPDSSGALEQVLIHFNTNRHQHHRKEMRFVGKDPVTNFDLFETTFEVGPQRDAFFHAIVDAIDNGTIFDSDEGTYPYRSTTWAVPYFIGQP